MESADDGRQREVVREIPVYMAQLENHIHTRPQAVEWVKAWLAKHRQDQ